MNQRLIDEATQREYEQRKRTIDESVAAAREPLSAQRLAKESSATGDKFSLQILNFWHPKDYEDLKKFFSVYRWIACAGFFTTDIPSIKFIYPKFIEKAEELINKGFCQSDEAIFAFLIDQYPDTFNISLGDYEDLINNYFGFKFKPKYNPSQYEDHTIAKKHSYIFNILKSYKMYRLDMYKKFESEFKIYPLKS
jgi:hypothetical protein